MIMFLHLAFQINKKGERERGRGGDIDYTELHYGVLPFQIENHSLLGCILQKGNCNYGNTVNNDI